MTDANVKLSDAELSLVCDEQFILTKNNIINKVFILFGQASENFLKQVEGHSAFVPPELRRLSPKIYRGENYRGLPYVTLDFPRFFSKDDTFAIRSFFWWGNFFSITLHLSGMYARNYTSGVNAFLKSKRGWYVCVNENAWEHHFGEDNYRLPDDENLTIMNERLEGKAPFLKISRKHRLNAWDETYDFLTENFRELLSITG